MYQPWNGLVWSCYVSFAVALGIALIGLQLQQIYITIMFGLLAYQSYQTIQQTTGGGGFGVPAGDRMQDDIQYVAFVASARTLLLSDSGKVMRTVLD
jgi:hypothetical protein